MDNRTTDSAQDKFVDKRDPSLNVVVDGTSYMDRVKNKKFIVDLTNDEED